jgi:hypothetical protein
VDRPAERLNGEKQAKRFILEKTKGSAPEQGSEGRAFCFLCLFRQILIIWRPVLRPGFLFYKLCCKGGRRRDGFATPRRPARLFFAGNKIFM